MAIGVEQFPILTPGQMSSTGDFMQESLRKFSNIINSSFAPQEKMEALKQHISDTLIKQAQAQYANPMEAAKLQESQARIPFIQAQTEHENALTPYTKAQTLAEQIKNKYGDQREKADIAEKLASANWKNTGGGGLGTGDKSELFFERSVGLDNPQLGMDPQKVREASNVLRSGGTQLKDGTPLNPLSEASKTSMGRVGLTGTTRPLATQLVQANQADAELKVLFDYATRGLAPYGTTYLNKSPEQITDSFKSDEDSQKRLGRFIAAKALNFESSQNRIKLAAGQPGVTATEELMKLSGQNIDGSYPRLSGTARQEAARYLDEALGKGLEARRNVGINVSQATNPASAGSLATAKQAIKTEGDKYTSQVVHMVSPDGKEYDVPQGKVQTFLDNKFTRKN